MVAGVDLVAVAIVFLVAIQGGAAEGHLFVTTGEPSAPKKSASGSHRLIVVSCLPWWECANSAQAIGDYGLAV